MENKQALLRETHLKASGSIEEGSGIRNERGQYLLILISLAGKGDLQPQLDNALQDVNDMYLLLEETEKQAVRKALIEERGRFCTFITFLQPVVVSASQPWAQHRERAITT